MASREVGVKKIDDIFQVCMDYRKLSSMVPVDGFLGAILKIVQQRPYLGSKLFLDNVDLLSSWTDDEKQEDRDEHFSSSRLSITASKKCRIVAA